MDRSAFTELVGERGNKADVRVLARVFAWSDQHNLRDGWEPSPAHDEAWVPVMRSIDWEPTPIGIGSSPPRLFLAGEELRRHHPFRSEQRWQSLVEQLDEIPNVVRSDQGLSRNILLRDLEDDAAWSPFFRVIDAMMTEVRRSSERNMR